MKMRVLVAFFLLASFLCVASVNASSYSGAWAPTDGDVNVINMTSAGVEFWVCDYQNLANSERLFTSDASPFSQKYLYFTQGASGNWTLDIKNSPSGSSVGSIDLGQSNLFQFYFVDNAGIKQTTYEISGADNAWNITYLGSVKLDVDAKPVPIPAAGILFGSGLLGMMGIGLKRKRKTLA
jgi:hypothetical protein